MCENPRSQIKAPANSGSFHFSQFAFQLNWDDNWRKIFASTALKLAGNSIAFSRIFFDANFFVRLGTRVIMNFALTGIKRLQIGKYWLGKVNSRSLGHTVFSCPLGAFPEQTQRTDKGSKSSQGKKNPKRNHKYACKNHMRGI
mmetsp:Transcript_53007/g.139770  ORF Transcript_53007/g.139770 Transcript_53007/m.139770 type:complete len:143 (+) Transcript_53007:248-676(+)